jgi:hypothetical protein
VAVLILPNRILDVQREREYIKVEKKWMVVVTPKVLGIEGYPAKLEFRIGWNGSYWVIW